MSKSLLSRRSALKLLGASAAVGAGVATTGAITGCASTGAPEVATKKLGRILVVGGGYGGATAAKYLKLWGGQSLDVVLIERSPTFVSCPMSNLVLGGSKKLEDMTMDYSGLRNAGIQVLIDEVTGIDATKRSVALRKIADQSYDRIVVSPGVDFMFDQIKGYDAKAQETVLHGWKAGPQTLALRKQLEAMPDGGVVVISIPKAPYRCPPGPYERACQIAWYLKNNKPRSKVLILDANEDIVSKKGLFTKAFNENYKGIIEYRNNWEAKELDAAGMTVISELGDRQKADVLNIIPPMRAGDIARSTGLITANNRWCGVDWVNMQSTAVPNVHVLGDSLLAAPLMPKSGHMANQHGKAAAAAIVEMMNGRTPQPTVMANTCYSYIDDKNCVHVASVHRYDATDKTMKTVPGSGGLSAAINELEGVYAWSWAQTIWSDMLT